jgi:hypothetical protein
MPHTFERAPTGRAKCRGCTKRIAAGELRFGERAPNPFAEGDAETTHWYHVPCAAFTRPEPFLEALTSTTETIDDRATLELHARAGIEHRRLPRVTTVERAATGRAACRSCRQPIVKGAWRISLDYYEDGRFAPAGFIHPACANAYLETTDIVDRLRHFSPAVTSEELDEIRAELASAAPA